MNRKIRIRDGSVALARRNLGEMMEERGTEVNYSKP